jgi:uncharacterized protein involved in response to NO
VTPEPYRVLFPIGAANAIAGALLWSAQSVGLIGWPSVLHRTLMIQGFEHAFVLGFLLTAMPAFTHGPRCHPLELILALASVALVDACAFAGLYAAAHTAYLFGLLVAATAVLRRVVKSGQRPPEEFIFAALGLAFGVVAAVMMIGVAAGGWPEPVPRFGVRLASLGLVLSLVLGLGSLLVPTFSGMRDPLAIPLIARPHQRAPRRALYLPLAAVLVAAFVAEALGRPALGATLRFAVATVMGLLVWKLWRLPGRRDVPALTLWASGWMLIAGLALAALRSDRPLAGEHVVFIGGFGLLTLGIGTRVIASHGGHPLALEPRILSLPVVLGALAALALRLLAEGFPARAPELLGASGALWALAWIWWGTRAIGLLARTRTGEPQRVTVAGLAKTAAGGAGSTGDTRGPRRNS